ncbi:MAG TPA: Ran-binding zinc finger domain-containing protein [Pyrinomonadaceae bacterium]
MASSRCPSCGLQNFSSAIVCRRCDTPLLKVAGRPDALPSATERKESFRWLRRATLFTILLAILLLPAVFLFIVVLGAKHGAETGMMDFTTEQKWTMVKWYVTSLGIAVIIIFTFFYLRRNNQD